MTKREEEIKKRKRELSDYEKDLKYYKNDDCDDDWSDKIETLSNWVKWKRQEIRYLEKITDRKYNENLKKTRIIKKREDIRYSKQTINWLKNEIEIEEKTLNNFKEKVIPEQESKIEKLYVRFNEVNNRVKCFEDELLKLIGDNK